jgi:hypothetical protein
MTIGEFKPNATNRCVEDVPGKMFARVCLGEAEKSTADADLNCSPLAPVVDGAPAIDCRRARAAGAPNTGRVACRDLAFHLFRQGAVAARQEFLSKAARPRSAQSFVKGFSIERLACGEPRTTRIISMRARNVAGTWRCPE